MTRCCSRRFRGRPDRGGCNTAPLVPPRIVTAVFEGSANEKSVVVPSNRQKVRSDSRPDGFRHSRAGVSRLQHSHNIVLLATFRPTERQMPPCCALPARRWTFGEWGMLRIHRRRREPDKRDGTGQDGTQPNAGFDLNALRTGIGAALRTLHSDVTMRGGTRQDGGVAEAARPAKEIRQCIMSVRTASGTFRV
jgi:hypothetical protein